MGSRSQTSLEPTSWFFGLARVLFPGIGDALVINLIDENFDALTNPSVLGNIVSTAPDSFAADSITFDLVISDVAGLLTPSCSASFSGGTLAGQTLACIDFPAATSDGSLLGEPHSAALLSTLVPEPGTAALVVPALLGLAVIARSRR